MLPKFDKQNLDKHNAAMVKKKMETAQDRFGDDGHVEAPIVTKRYADTISELDNMRNAPVVNYELVLSLPDLNSVGNPNYQYRWVKETHKRIEHHKRLGYIKVPENHFPDSIPIKIEGAALGEDNKVCAMVAMVCRKDAFNERMRKKTEDNNQLLVANPALVDAMAQVGNSRGFVQDGCEIDGKKLQLI